MIFHVQTPIVQGSFLYHNNDSQQKFLLHTPLFSHLPDSTSNRENLPAEAEMSLQVFHSDLPLHTKSDRKPLLPLVLQDTFPEQRLFFAPTVSPQDFHCEEQQPYSAELLKFLQSVRFDIPALTLSSDRIPLIPLYPGDRRKPQLHPPVLQLLSLFSFHTTLFHPYTQKILSHRKHFSVFSLPSPMLKQHTNYEYDWILPLDILVFLQILQHIKSFYLHKSARFHCSLTALHTLIQYPPLFCDLSPGQILRLDFCDLCNQKRLLDFSLLPDLQAFHLKSLLLPLELSFDHGSRPTPAFQGLTQP